MALRTVFGFETSAPSRLTFTGGPMLLFGSLFSMSPDWLVKLVQEGGRTRLTLISLVVVVVGVLAYLFFAKENTWVKIVAWFMIFGGAVFLIAVLVTPDKSDAQTNANGGAVQKALILAEVTDAYKSTGWELAFFDDWGRPPTRQTLHVNQTTLTGTSTDGRTVSMSVDPRQLPMPKYYNANSAQISTLGSKEAPEVIRFFQHMNSIGRHLST